MASIKLPIYNESGKTDKTIVLDESVFGVKANIALLHQAINTHLANRRASTAHTKNRGEVSGGGKKPWAQKGTGKARAGSSRSPLWIGGGITFGPRAERNYSMRFPQKMRQLALKMALSSKVTDSQLIIIDKFAIASGKTKDWLAFDKQLPQTGKHTLIISAPDTESNRAVRNVAKYLVAGAEDVSIYDIMRSQRIILTPADVNKIYERVGIEPAKAEKTPTVEEKA